MPCSVLICEVMILVRSPAPRAPARARNKPFGAMISFFFFNLDWSGGKMVSEISLDQYTHEGFRG